MFDLRNLAPVVQTDTDRIMKLPTFNGYGDDAIKYGETFCLPTGTWKLKVHQAEALYTIHKGSGALLFLGVGAGKTLVSWLAGRACGAKRVVILVRPADIKTYHKEVGIYKDHFDPGDSEIFPIAYTTLSSKKSHDILSELKPDLIVADEAQCITNVSARTRRFWRYMDDNPTTKLVAMSGTLIRSSVRDITYLADAALSDRSPVPKPTSPQLQVWSHVIDRVIAPMPEEVDYLYKKIALPYGLQHRDKIHAIREGVGRRIVQTEGVVFTPQASTDQALTIQRIHYTPSPAILEAIQYVMDEGLLPNGDHIEYEDEVSTADQKVNVCRLMVSGFYYRRAWETMPNGKDYDWIDRRRAYHFMISQEIKCNARSGFDSPALIRDELLRQIEQDPKLITTSFSHFTLAQWLEVSDRPVPPLVVEWIDQSLVLDVIARYRDKSVILWYNSNAVGALLREHGIDTFGTGTFLEGPERLVAASIRVHGVSRNLQDWDHAVVIEPPSSGLVWEQLLGRLHRQGQQRSVKYDVIVGHDMMDKVMTGAIDHARMIQSLQQTPMRLMHATHR